MSRGQLYLLHAEMILNRQLPALISLWCFQKERCRQIASNAKIAAASDADRAVDMGRECLAPGIAVEQGWKHLQRQSGRSEEHTSELQSLMRISYAVFCLQNKNKTRSITKGNIHTE